MSRPKVSAVDLFCGVGGLTYGLEEAGIDVKVGVDADPACEYPYEENTGSRFVKADVTELDAERIESWFEEGSIRLLAGCAPCQPFSPLNNSDACDVDGKWGLLYSFADFIEEIEPEIVTMENVPRVENHQVFDDFLETLHSLDYDVYYDVHDARPYGVPQKRKRLVLIASKVGEIELREGELSEEEYRTVRDEIEDLPAITSGGQDPEDVLHRSSQMSEKNLKRIRHSEPGGTWEEWPEELKLACHKKDSGKSYTDVYGRMNWDEASPTITTQAHKIGTGRFGHPEQDRPISFREMAILQSFPPDYKFVDGEDFKHTEMGRLIGNAVPPKLGKAVGESIIKVVS